MAFKSKIKPDELKEMTQIQYIKRMQKEVTLASKFGHTGVVILSDYKFSCSNVGTMMLLGKLSGPLMKFYKQQKRERKVEKDYALGTCYFKKEENQAPTMHIALKDGKGKPNKMMKHGKSMFKKLGYAPNIFKGEILEGNEKLDQSEVDHITEEADKSNDSIALNKVAQQYSNALKIVSNVLIPMIQQGDKATFEKQHFEAAKKAFFYSKSFVDRYQEVNEKQRTKFVNFYTKVLERQPTLQRITAKIKQRLMQSSQVQGNSDNMQKTLEDVGKAVARMRNNINRAMEIINNL